MINDDEPDEERGLFSFWQRQQRWLWPVPLALLLALSAPQFLRLYYKYVELPRIERSVSANIVVAPCVTHVSALPELAPKHCDVAVTTHDAAGRQIETFHHQDGSTSSLTTLNGRWKGSGGHCVGVERGMYVFYLAMILWVVATLNQSFRTGQFFWVPGMKRHAFNDFEMVVAAYAVAIFAGSMVSFAAPGSCEGLAAVASPPSVPCSPKPHTCS